MYIYIYQLVSVLQNENRQHHRKKRKRKILYTKIQTGIKFNIKYASGDANYEFVTFNYPPHYYTQRNVFPTLPYNLDNVFNMNIDTEI